MNKYLYVAKDCMNDFSLIPIGHLTYTNISNYIKKYQGDMMLVSFDDFGNIYIESNQEKYKQCPEFVRVALLLKGGRYEKA